MPAPAPIAEQFSGLLGTSFRKEIVFGHLTHFLENVKKAYELKIAAITNAHERAHMQHRFEQFARDYLYITQYLAVHSNPSDAEYEKIVGKFHYHGLYLLKKMGYPELSPLKLHQLIAPLRDIKPASAPCDQGAVEVGLLSGETLSGAQQASIKRYIESQLNLAANALNNETVHYVPSHLMTAGMRNFRTVSSRDVDCYGSSSFVPYKMKDKAARKVCTLDNVKQVAGCFVGEGEEAAINVSIITPTQGDYPWAGDYNVRSTGEMVHAFTQFNNDLARGANPFQFFDFYFGVNVAQTNWFFRGLSKLAGVVEGLRQRRARSANNYKHPLERNKDNFVSLITKLSNDAFFNCLQTVGAAGSVERQLVGFFDALAAPNDHKGRKTWWKQNKDRVKTLIQSINQDKSLQAVVSEEQQNATKALVALFTACEFFYEDKWSQKQHIFKLQSSLLAVAHYTGMAPLTNCKSGQDRTRDMLAYTHAYIRLTNELYNVQRTLDLNNPSQLSRLKLYEEEQRASMPAMDLNKGINATKKPKLKHVNKVDEVGLEEALPDAMPGSVTRWSIRRAVESEEGYSSVPLQQDAFMSDGSIVTEETGLGGMRLTQKRFSIYQKLLSFIQGKRDKLQSAELTAAVLNAERTIAALRDNNNPVQISTQAGAAGAKTNSYIESAQTDVAALLDADKTRVGILLQYTLPQLMKVPSAWLELQTELDKFGIHYTGQTVLFASITQYVTGYDKKGGWFYKGEDKTAALKGILLNVGVDFGGQYKDLTQRDRVLYLLNRLRPELRKWRYASGEGNTTSWKQIMALVKPFHISDAQIESFDVEDALAAVAPPARPPTPPPLPAVAPAAPAPAAATAEGDDGFSLEAARRASRAVAAAMLKTAAATAAATQKRWDAGFFAGAATEPPAAAPAADPTAAAGAAGPRHSRVIT